MMKSLPILNRHCRLDGFYLIREIWPFAASTVPWGHVS